MNNAALIVTAELSIKRRLLELVPYVPTLNKVIASANLIEARQALNSATRVGAIFIRNEFPQSSIATFIEETKKTFVGQDTCFILLISEEDQNSEIVANHLLIGFHGFLCEPFCLESVVETTNIASGVRMCGSKARIKAATGMLLSEMVPAGGSLLDQIRRTLKEIRRIAGNSATISVVNSLHKLSPSKRLEGYDGASSRVKDLFRKRLSAYLANSNPRED